MDYLDIFLPLSLTQLGLVEAAKALSESYGDSEQKAKLRIAALLLNNKNESAANQARGFNLFVKKFMPTLFSEAKKTADSASVTRSNNTRYGKYFYYLSFTTHPEYRSDPWHGAISKAEILREAIIQNA